MCSFGGRIKIDKKVIDQAWGLCVKLQCWIIVDFHIFHLPPSWYVLGGSVSQTCLHSIPHTFCDPIPNHVIQWAVLSVLNKSWHLRLPWVSAEVNNDSRCRSIIHFNFIATSLLLCKSGFWSVGPRATIRQKLNTYRINKRDYANARVLPAFPRKLRSNSKTFSRFLKRGHFWHCDGTMYCSY